MKLQDSPHMSNYRSFLACSRLPIVFAAIALSLMSPSRPSVVWADEPASVKLLASGMTNPESVAIGTDGRIYVSVIGEFDKDGDGSVVTIEDGKGKPFATGLDDPKGLVAWKDKLFTADKKRVWQIDAAGKATVYAAAKDFPRPPTFLNDLAIDDAGTLYVSDSGDLKGEGGAVFAISAPGKVKLVTNSAYNPKIKGPNGLWIDDKNHLLLLDFVSGELSRVNLTDGKLQRVTGRV